MASDGNSFYHRRASCTTCLRQGQLQARLYSLTKQRHELPDASIVEELADVVFLAFDIQKGLKLAIADAYLKNDVISASARFAMPVSAWMVHIAQNGGRSKIEIASRSFHSFANTNDAAKVGMSRGSTKQAVTVVPASASSLSYF